MSILTLLWFIDHIDGLDEETGHSIGRVVLCEVSFVRGKVAS